MQPDYIVHHTLSTWERRYLYCGLASLFEAAFQFMIFWILIASQNLDLLFAYPLLSLVTWTVPSALLHSFIWKAAAGNREYAEEFAHYHYVSRIPLFSLHTGILILTRIVFIVLVRKITMNCTFRQNEPYILWLP